jgi:hypothetical protein
MSEPRAIFRNWGSEVLRHWRERRTLAANQSHGAARETYDLERIATCACSGYFHTGYALDPFVFTPELRESAGNRRGLLSNVRAQLARRPRELRGRATPSAVQGSFYFDRIWQR